MNEKSLCTGLRYLTLLSAYVAALKSLSFLDWLIV